MQRAQLPAVGVIIASLAVLAIPVTHVIPSNSRTVVFFALVGALSAAVLGAVGFSATRGDFPRRATAVACILLGGLLSLYLGLVFWLSTPF